MIINQLCYFVLLFKELGKNALHTCNISKTENTQKKKAYKHS